MVLLELARQTVLNTSILAAEICGRTGEQTDTCTSGINATYTEFAVTYTQVSKLCHANPTFCCCCKYLSNKNSLFREYNRTNSLNPIIKFSEQKYYIFLFKCIINLCFYHARYEWQHKILVLKMLNVSFSKRIFGGVSPNDSCDLLWHIINTCRLHTDRIALVMSLSTNCKVMRATEFNLQFA